jgi:16S rRNA (guanine(966)-N(2))-methyltransferase RsmD
MSLKILSGKWRGRVLSSPKSDKIRPTSAQLRKSVFDICQGQISEAIFLDLFAGSGLMGFEALSRGAKKAAFVDVDRASIECIKKNSMILDCQKDLSIYQGDAVSVLKKLAQKKSLFTMVYIDPPYPFFSKENYIENLFSLLSQEGVLEKGAIVFLEQPFSKEKEVKPYEFLSFSLIDQRRHGIALLSRYQFCS